MCNVARRPRQAFNSKPWFAGFSASGSPFWPAGFEAGIVPCEAGLLMIVGT